jgi:hypothetical protein
MLSLLKAFLGSFIFALIVFSLISWATGWVAPNWIFWGVVGLWTCQDWAKEIKEGQEKEEWN